MYGGEKKGTTCIEKRCFSIHDYCLLLIKLCFISKKGRVAQLVRARVL